jgi:hypothetical protein
VFQVVSPQGVAAGPTGLLFWAWGERVMRDADLLYQGMYSYLSARCLSGAQVGWPFSWAESKAQAVCWEPAALLMRLCPAV